MLYTYPRRCRRLLSGSPTNMFHLNICALISFVLKYVAKHIFDKAPVPKIYKVKTQQQANSPITKTVKDWNKYVTKEDTQRGNKLMRRCSISSVGGRRKVETMLRHHCAPSERPGPWGCPVVRTLRTPGTGRGTGGHGNAHSLPKTACWGFLQKINPFTLRSSSPAPWYLPAGFEDDVHGSAGIQMFTAGLFIIAQTWKCPRCPSQVMDK